MSQPAISVQNVNKEYIIGAHRNASESFREMLTNSLKAPIRRFRKLDRKAVTEAERFWALKDVNFEVNEGDVVGIIGRNGAGKSTLLKILSRITEPTSGRVTMRGRVASLLEVGTGFHPELTGRENVYLNGAIIGMTHTEIRSKFDEIIAFAGIEKFLDTPVKRYSSGMYVRLAFAVAAHLEPEILLVDEVLAVGDAEFQKRCLGKMQTVANQGRTVFFVSHNMNAIQTLCGRAILLDKGRISENSTDVRGAINAYLQAGSANTPIWHNSEDEYRALAVRPLEFFIGDEHGVLISQSIANTDVAYMYIKAHINTMSSDLDIGYALYNKDNTLIYITTQADVAVSEQLSLHKGDIYLRSRLPYRLLNEGIYNAELHASFHNRAWILRPGVNSPRITFEIRGGLSDSPTWVSPREGMLAPVMLWETVSKPAQADAQTCAFA
jgi:lipopolysaccharide transport system ATP-binding protein